MSAVFIDDCPESDMVECLLEPCSTAQCTGYPEAICHNNYCGVCQAVWKNPDGHPVTCDRFSPPGNTCRVKQVYTRNGAVRRREQCLVILIN